MFNACIGHTLDSNSDLQVILDCYSCARYVVDYVNMANRGSSKLYMQVADMLRDNPDFRCADALRRLGV